MFGRKRKSAEVHTKSSIRFVCEQDGAPERLLKQAVVEELASASDTKRAYLARVEYGDPSAYEVALCLAGRTNEKLVSRIGLRFAEIFGRDAHLDILFLTDEREAELKRVCAPFHNVV